MADLVDLAQQQQERMAFVLEKYGKNIFRVAPEATGFCLSCGEPLPDGRRWCNADCRDDWERRDRLFREKGM
jgi:RNA polymerase-binding transcription factor DksA